MTAINVVDSLSNRPEHIKEAVSTIGRSTLKLAVFQAVYHHKQRVKTVAEIVDRTNLTRKQVLQSGGALVKAGIMTQERKDGDTAYKQILYIQNSKNKIIDYVQHPQKLEKLVTKREPSFNFEKVNVKSVPRTPVRSSRRPVSARTLLRIAFLSTNPDVRATLRTDKEARDVSQAIRKSTLRDKVEVRYFPASQPTDLLDALNEFKPNIVHFSGHGGGGSVLFDDSSLEGEGGVELDFDVINDAMNAVTTPPKMIVLNACDTLDGAEVLLDSVELVVAMSSSLLDVSAIVFSTRFYQALAESQPVLYALNQGKVAIKMAQLQDADLPTVISRKGIDPSNYVLVR